MESTVLVKAFAILEATAGTLDGVALGELSFRVGVNKPTTHRILKTLSTLGYVEKSGFGRYRSTDQIRRLVTGADDHRLLAAASAPLQQLHTKSKETVNLGVLRANRVAYLQVLESPQPLRRVASPNSLDDVHCTALGRVLLAYLPDARCTLLLRGPLKRRTPHTVVDPGKLKQIVHRVASLGFAVESDQTDLGVTCIAAPVFEVGNIVAAISISLPTARMDGATESSLIKAARMAARSVEKNLRSNQSCSKRSRQ